MSSLKLYQGVVAPSFTPYTGIAESQLVAPNIDGLQLVRVARFTFDPSAVAGHRTIAPHTFAVTIPAKAIILDGGYQVITTFTSATDAATIALSVEGANDIVSALAISNGGNIWDAGIHDVVPVNTAATAVKTTVARLVTATVAVEALLLGKLVGFLRYVVSA